MMIRAKGCLLSLIVFTLIIVPTSTFSIGNVGVSQESTTNASAMLDNSDVETPSSSNSLLNPADTVAPLDNLASKSDSPTTSHTASQSDGMQQDVDLRSLVQHHPHDLLPNKALSPSESLGVQIIDNLKSLIQDHPNNDGPNSDRSSDVSPSPVAENSKSSEKKSFSDDTVKSVAEKIQETIGEGGVIQNVAETIRETIKDKDLDLTSQPTLPDMSYDDLNDDSFYDEYLADELSSHLPLPTGKNKSNHSDVYWDDDMFGIYETDDHGDELLYDEKDVDAFNQDDDFYSLDHDDESDLGYPDDDMSEFEYPENEPTDDIDDGELDLENEFEGTWPANRQGVKLKKNIWHFGDDSTTDELADDSKDYPKSGPGVPTLNIRSPVSSNRGLKLADDALDDEAEDDMEDLRSLRPQSGPNRLQLLDDEAEDDVYGNRLADIMKIYEKNTEQSINSAKRKFNDAKALSRVYDAIMNMSNNKGLRKGSSKAFSKPKAPKGDRTKQIRRLQRLKTLMQIAANRQASKTSPIRKRKLNHIKQNTRSGFRRPSNTAGNFNSVRGVQHHPRSTFRDAHYHHPTEVRQPSVKTGESSGQPYARDYWGQDDYDEDDEAEDDIIERLFGLRGFNGKGGHKNMHGTCPALPVKVDKTVVTIKTAEGCEIVLNFALRGHLNEEIDRDSLDVQVSYRSAHDN